VLATAAHATPVGIADYVALNVSPGALYSGAPAPYQWDTTWRGIFPTGSPATNGSTGDGVTNLVIAPTGLSAPASFVWTGNPLAADTSAGGVASATFGAGGSFTLTGSIYNFAMGFAPIFTGVLMTGPVSGFTVVERTPGPGNFIDTPINPIFTPVAGALVDGTLPIRMTGNWYMPFSGAQVSENGGPLVDFQGDLSLVQGTLVAMSRVPEPGTIALLGGMALLAIHRRRA
jgi:hypothetical protein